MNITPRIVGTGAGAGAGAGGGAGGGAGVGGGARGPSASSLVAARAALSTVHVVVTPGETITTEGGFLQGHGVYAREDGSLVASVAGIVERVNRLVSVRPMNARYTGEVGDVVVGRVREVGTKRWKIDINARQDAVLMLSSVNLSGGVQRRRTTEDQMNMRAYFAEDDLISADVHSIYADGAVSLHARSLKYGKLQNGDFVTVPPALVKRLKQHFVALPCGVDVILGTNGFIWLSETVPDAEARAAIDTEGADAGLAEAVEARRRYLATRHVSAEARLKIARVRNAVSALGALYVAVTPTTIMDVYEASMEMRLEARDLLNPDYLEKITRTARERHGGGSGGGGAASTSAAGGGGGAGGAADFM